MQTYFAIGATTGLRLVQNCLGQGEDTQQVYKVIWITVMAVVMGLYLDIPYTKKVRTSRVFPSLAVSGSLDPIPGILGNGAAKDQSDSRP